MNAVTGMNFVNLSFYSIWIRFRFARTFQPHQRVSIALFKRRKVFETPSRYV